VKDQALDEDSDVNNSKLTLSDVWKLVRKHYPDVDIDSDLKQKMKDLVVHVIAATRSTIELRYIEHIGQKTGSKNNNRFFQILGFDIMFDTDLAPWLFEVNSYPSMDIFYEKDNLDGTVEKASSAVDEMVKGTVFSEAAKIVLAKAQSDVFELVYDSEQISSDYCQLYETIFGIYKKL